MAQPNSVPLTEQQIINYAYNILEQDNTYWDPSSVEYLTARGLLNLGINHWETYDNVRWRVLYKRLSDASDGIKTLTAGIYSYSCPSDMRYPSSAAYVRTVNNNNSTFWQVIPPDEIGKWDNTIAFYCYFTGNAVTGYTLNFNPKQTLSTGDTISYEYWKMALGTSAITDRPEMSDPTFLAYWVAAHMADGGLDPELFNIGQEILENMKTINWSGATQVPDKLDPELDYDAGFGA